MTTNAWSVFFLYAHSWTVYQCTLNVSLSFSNWWPTLRLCWHCFLCKHPTQCVSWLKAYAAEAWYTPECRFWHWENNDQTVFKGWYSMVYYLSNTVCVSYFPTSWWGGLAGVFIKSLNLCNVNMKSQITLTNLTFTFLSCWSVLSPLRCIWLCFHCTANVWRSKLSLGTQTEEVSFREKTWVCTRLKTFFLLLQPYYLSDCKWNISHK